MELATEPPRHTTAPCKTGRDKLNDASRPTKRRCVSSACIACRRRKSKCDGNTPACAACSSVYHTECVYDLNSDHRRKGVYKKDIDNLKTQNGTLQTLVEAILNYPEDKVFDLVREIRACDSLEDLAERIAEEQKQLADGLSEAGGVEGDSPASQGSIWQDDGDGPTSLEAELSGKMGALRLEEGQVRFIGATSNLMLLPSGQGSDTDLSPSTVETQRELHIPILSWTTVTQDKDLILHLITLYFTYHYPFFTTLSKDLFYREFFRGKRDSEPRRVVYCTSLLVNIMLALGCHFTTWKAARANPEDSATAGDHFFKEAKRIIFENDEHENPRLTTVQALALMSVREAGCGREAKGWVYSGMSFRMAMDLGLHLDPTTLKEDEMTDEEVDARRITFWGCFLFDKCWSNYMGRMPQLPSAMVTVPKPDVFPSEDSDNWVPYTDEGVIDAAQPSRIRAISLQISMLCEISNDILLVFYNPTPASNQPQAKILSKSSVGAEFKKLGELFSRLEEWRKRLPPELEARGGSLPSTLLMHMFHQTLYIHLFRPFLKFSSTSSTPLSHLDPRKACLAAATTISKYLRFYKHRYKLRQICNVAGYFIHSAATIHLLNLPQKTAARDIVQSLQALEDMGECWLVARRSLVIIDILVRRWRLEIPEEAAVILARSRGEAKRWGLQEKAGMATSTTTANAAAAATVATNGIPLPAEYLCAVEPAGECSARGCNGRVERRGSVVIEGSGRAWGGFGGVGTARVGGE
ncbi:hypothetical protein K440DRAFT_649976 [Wilcoxina mikolae CBS 423.85]|nr:hypothetical protein K440DRAFT_649976 [Wilcoxina mikolae CBS 423.85]